MTLLTLVLGGSSALSRCTILCSVAIRSVSSAVDQRSTSPSPKSRRYEVLIAVCMLFSSEFAQACPFHAASPGRFIGSSHSSRCVTRRLRVCSLQRLAIPMRKGRGSLIGALAKVQDHL